MLMLAHHLFFYQNGLYEDVIFNGINIVHEIGTWAKVCVTLFVFLSGYGLTISALKTEGVKDLKSFYWHRYKKLYLNYWFVWLIFVPIGVFVFDRTLIDAYQTHIAIKFVLDILGISWLFVTLGYNPTWWFYSCIILLYLVYPLLFKLMKMDMAVLLTFAFVLSFLPIPFLYAIQFNIIAFVLGMWMANTKSTPTTRTGIFLIFIFSMLVVLCLLRNNNLYPILVDALISFLMVLTYKLIHTPRIFSISLSFLGRHSMNIFLFHTFIFKFWFKDFVYSSRNPIIIFLTLLAICLLISIALEWIKKYTIYKL